jgi:quinoprotein dehydrogenase-associated probable ABC transporter substrate-binding protein
MLIAGCLATLTSARAEMAGQLKIQASKSEFRVCADPDNLPFTNRQGEGFENKIAELLARSADQPLAYYWWPERRGFVNATLNAWECDVIIGVPARYELARTTRPYYCSRYVMVHRADQGITPSLLGEPRVRSLRIGAVEHTPPLDMLLRRDLNPVVYFTNYDYLSNSPGQIVADVASGKLDVALVWGPIGGYFARRQAVPLQTVALEDPADPEARLAFPISFGVRRADKDRSARIERLMHERAAEIQAILGDNGVPLADDPIQCAPLHQHASSDRGPLVQLVADAATTYPDVGTAHAQQKLAELTGASHTTESDHVDCKGTETMQDIEKLAGGPSAPGKSYTVQDGKVDATTYIGWLRYSAFCQTCHGSGGVGSAIAPDLTQAMKSLNKRQFETIVSCGLKGNLGTGVMPAWGDNPNIRPYIENLWTYLSARADGALAPGRPQKLSTSKSSTQ